METAGGRRATQLIMLAVFVGWPSLAAGAPTSDALDVAVRDLGADHDRATAAMYRLQAGGEAAASALHDAWPSMSLLAKKRALPALRSLAREHGAAVESLVEAARSEDERLREGALRALSASGRLGRTGLVQLLDEPGVGDRAASLLARGDPDRALKPLLEAITRPGGSDRPELRDALAVAAERASSPGRAIGAWLRTSPPPAAVASVALALRDHETERVTTASLVAHAAPRSEDFATIWRLLRSAGGAGPDADIDRWVQQQLTEPEPWMLRAAAVDASAARGFRERTRPALADPYPRVRARAATALSGDGGSLVARATLARKDVWPLVRAAAVTSLRGERDGLPVVVAAVDDSMSVVRAAAIEALTPASHDQGWDRIHRRLRASNEWPKVTAAAIEYAAAHCRADAAESLFRVVMRAAPANALTEDLNNAARAIEALRTLGTPETDAVIRRLRATPEVPPTLKIALDRPLPEAARCARPGS